MSAKVPTILVLTISSKKAKKGYLHGLQVKKKTCFLLIKYAVKQTFYLHKLLNALLKYSFLHIPIKLQRMFLHCCIFNLGKNISNSEGQ